MLLSALLRSFHDAHVVMCSFRGWIDNVAKACLLSGDPGLEWIFYLIPKSWNV